MKLDQGKHLLLSGYILHQRIFNLEAKIIGAQLQDGSAHMDTQKIPEIAAGLTI